MKSKFSSTNDSGIKIGFKLPDGKKTEYVFRENSTVKVYQLPYYIYLMMCIDNLPYVDLTIGYVPICCW